jgi:hypothetical protein
MNESSNVLAITALRDNLGRKGADTPAAPFFRHKPRDKRAVALRVVGLRNRYGTNRQDSPDQGAATEHLEFGVP